MRLPGLPARPSSATTVITGRSRTTLRAVSGPGDSTASGSLVAASTSMRLPGCRRAARAGSARRTGAATRSAPYPAAGGSASRTSVRISPARTGERSALPSRNGPGPARRQGRQLREPRGRPCPRPVSGESPDRSRAATNTSTTGGRNTRSAPVAASAAANAARSRRQRCQRDHSGRRTVVEKSFMADHAMEAAMA